MAATIVGVVWLVTFKVTPIDAQAGAPATAPSATSRDVPRSATAAPRTAAPGTTAIPGTQTGAPGNGTFTGSTIRTIYGDVQVRVTIAGQKIADVQATLLPQDRARSARISQYSAPILRTEAIQAQSATIDIVSGATYTSIAYSRSLDSALKQAHLG
jgi:uncharacterized protein with FMN-binding domain